MTGIVTRRRAEHGVCDTPPAPCKIRRQQLSPPRRKHKSSRLQHSLITFEYGPPELNLYKYLAEESFALWKKTRGIFALRKDSQPLDGLILIHGDSENAQGLSMELFDFDPETTTFNTVDTHHLKEKDYVVVCYLGVSFWEDNEILMKGVRDAVKYVNKSSLFFVIESEDDIEKKKTLVRNRFSCLAANVIRANGDKSAIYDGLYTILENNLSNFLSDIEMKVMTRQVGLYKSQLDILMEKLHFRNHKTASKLTHACIRKIKRGKPFGVIGYRLCGDTLCILEIEQAVTQNEKQMVPIRKSIKENFVGKVIFHTVKSSSFHPHCNVKCGGYLLNRNEDNCRSGTIGIFGEMRRTRPEDLSVTSEVVVLTSGHIIYDGEIANISVNDDIKRIGICIWPIVKDKHSSNLHDVSVVLLDNSVLTKLQRSILKKNVIVDELSRADLTYRKVFKYGATTGRTEGFIQKINDFEIFGCDVMIIVPRSTDDEDRKFSDKGDSGAIVLTKIGNQLYGIGMVYGDQLDLPQAECASVSNESIAIGLKRAVDRFTSQKGVVIEFDEI